jgi:hypothetical protein
MEYEQIIRRQQELRRILQRTTKFRQGLAVEALCHAYRAVQDNEGSPRILVVMAEFKQQATSLVRKFGSALAKLEGEPVAFWNGNRDGQHWKRVRKSPRSILTFRQMVDLLPEPLFEGSARKVYDNDDEAWANRASSVCHQVASGQIVARDHPMGPASPGGIPGVLENCRILGPYFFPTFTVLLLLIRLTLGEKVPGLFDVLVGFSLGYHLASRWKQIPDEIQKARKDPHKKPDFARFGVPFLLAFVVMAQWIIIPSVLLAVHGGWMSAAQYVVAGQGFWVDLIIN